MEIILTIALGLALFGCILLAMSLAAKAIGSKND
jgi:hypothetical protein